MDQDKEIYYCGIRGESAYETNIRYEKEIAGDNIDNGGNRVGCYGHPGGHT